MWRRAAAEFVMRTGRRGLNLVANLFEYFERAGHLMDAAPDGPTVCTSPAAGLTSVLDWGLPRMDGHAVLAVVA